MAGGAWALWNVGLGSLLGAAGVALAAVAAHRTSDPTLATAAIFLILHAGAAIALTALSAASHWPSAVLASATLMLLAVMLFSGDVVSRVLLGDRLFPMAAPTGGSLLILAWLISAATAIAGALRGS